MCSLFYLLTSHNQRLQWQSAETVGGEDDGNFEHEWNTEFSRPQHNHVIVGGPSESFEGLDQDFRPLFANVYPSH